MIDNTLAKLFTLHLPLKDVTEFDTSEHIWKCDNILNLWYYYTLEKGSLAWYIQRYESRKIFDRWTIPIISDPFSSFNNKFFFTRKGAIKYMTRLGLVNYIRNI